MQRILNIVDIYNILANPVTKEPLVRIGDTLKSQTLNQHFPLLRSSKSPLLFPYTILSFCKEEGLDLVELIKNKGAIEQYFGISYIKWIGGSHNSSPDSNCYQNYLNVFKELVSDVNGLVLDIGCDDPQNTVSYFPKDTKYVGVDPLYYLPGNSFKIFAVSEFLPFLDCSFDAVCFGTSLDHCFDPNTALCEAHRILKKGGSIYLATLVWVQKAELYNDCVHFHHFRERHILDMIRDLNLSIRNFFKMSWKNDVHREVLFLKATKTL